MRLLPFLKLGFHHARRALKSKPNTEACFYLNGGNNHSADGCKILLMSERTSYSSDDTWERVIICGGTAYGEQELSAATVTADASGYAGASGGPHSLVWVTATVFAAVSATAVTTAAAAAAATVAAVTIAITAAVIVTAAAIVTVTAAAVAAAAAATAAVVAAVSAATATAATALKACCRGAG